MNGKWADTANKVRQPLRILAKKHKRFTSALSILNSGKLSALPLFFFFLIAVTQKGLAQGSEKPNTGRSAHPAVIKQRIRSIPGIFRITDSGSVFHDPPFSSCHAATIAEVAKDTLLYAWFGGDHEGADNGCIWGCFRYTRQKQQWGKPMLLAAGKDSTGENLPCWNPVLFKTRSGTLILDYKAGKTPRAWWAMRRISMDNGRSWSAPKPLPHGFLGPIKNKPIQLKNGDILYGSSVESEDMIHWTVHAEISNETGTEWKQVPVDCDSFAVIQPTFLTYGADTIQMLCRSKQNRIAESWSYDGGKNWTTIRATKLENPNSGIDGITLSNGYQLLVCNPLSSGTDWWNGRNRLVVMGSADGNIWETGIMLESAPEGEFSYPAIITDRHGIIRIAYTYNRKNIKFTDLQLK